MSPWGHCPLTQVPNRTLSELKKRLGGIFKSTHIPHKPPARNLLPGTDGVRGVTLERWDKWEGWALAETLGTTKNVILFFRGWTRKSGIIYLHCAPLIQTYHVFVSHMNAKAFIQIYSFFYLSIQSMWNVIDFWLWTEFKMKPIYDRSKLFWYSDTR